MVFVFANDFVCFASDFPEFCSIVTTSRHRCQATSKRPNIHYDSFRRAMGPYMVSIVIPRVLTRLSLPVHLRDLQGSVMMRRKKRRSTVCFQRQRRVRKALARRARAWSKQQRLELQQPMLFRCRKVALPFRLTYRPSIAGFVTPAYEEAGSRLPGVREAAWRCPAFPFLPIDLPFSRTPEGERQIGSLREKYPLGQIWAMPTGPMSRFPVLVLVSTSLLLASRPACPLSTPPRYLQAPLRSLSSPCNRAIGRMPESAFRDVEDRH